MRTKEKLLALLEANRGTFLSGEMIAADLRVSRASVWKAIDALRADGFAIDAATNRGYSLSPESDHLTAPGIARHLGDLPYRVEVCREASSTNALLHDRRNEGEGLVIAANRQTDGAGRMGRGFFSPPDSGIYCSILLKPDMLGADAAILTAMAGVAVCRAIGQLSDQQPWIKWVNDIFIGDKKVCGILTQASFSLENQRAEFAILGIGVNVYVPKDGFPEELQEIAGAVFDRPQGGMRNRLLAGILREFWALYRGAEVLDAYRAYNRLIGREVAFDGRTALAVGIDERCRLVVRHADGREEALSSGEVSVR